MVGIACAPADVDRVVQLLRANREDAVESGCGAKDGGGKRQLAEWVKATTEGKESLKGGFSRAELKQSSFGPRDHWQMQQQGRVQTPQEVVEMD